MVEVREPCTTDIDMSSVKKTCSIIIAHQKLICFLIALLFREGIVSDPSETLWVSSLRNRSWDIGHWFSWTEDPTGFWASCMMQNLATLKLVASRLTEVYDHQAFHSAEISRWFIYLTQACLNYCQLQSKSKSRIQVKRTKSLLCFTPVVTR